MMQKITFLLHPTLECHVGRVVSLDVPRRKACRTRRGGAYCKTNHVPKTEWKKRTRKHRHYIQPESSGCVVQQQRGNNLIVKGAT